MPISVTFYICNLSRKGTRKLNFRPFRSVFDWSSIGGRWVFVFKIEQATKSFPSYGDTGTGYNRATSALMSRAIVGAYPDTFLSYPKILISQGPLPAAENASATLQADESILFTCADNSTTGIAQPKDKVLLVAYFPQGGNIIYSLNAGVREDGHALLINKDPKGYAAETWIGFISDDQKDASNSVYTGTL